MSERIWCVLFFQQPPRDKKLLSDYFRQAFIGCHEAPESRDEAFTGQTASITSNMLKKKEKKRDLIGQKEKCYDIQQESQGLYLCFPCCVPTSFAGSEMKQETLNEHAVSQHWPKP